MKAVIQTGGKQVIVSEGDVILVELLEGAGADEASANVSFNDIRMILGYGASRIGKPTVEGAKVDGVVLAEVKGPKTRAVKFRRRKDSMTTKGHRQRYHRVKITAIQA